MKSYHLHLIAAVWFFSGAASFLVGLGWTGIICICVGAGLNLLALDDGEEDELPEWVKDEMDI